jgi:hypothetical protein
LSLPRSRFVEPRWMPQLRNLPHLRSEEPRHIGFPNRPHVSSKSPRHLQPQRTFHASASKASAPTNPCGTIETSAPKLGTSSSEEPSTLQLQKASALRAPKKGLQYLELHEPSTPGAKRPLAPPTSKRPALLAPPKRDLPRVSLRNLWHQEPTLGASGSESLSVFEFQRTTGI